MNTFYNNTLYTLAAAGNLRSIPAGTAGEGVTDMSTNDYLGLASDIGLQQQFLAEAASQSRQLLTSSASRLLASAQSEYAALESLLSQLYDGRQALMMNSGWHANTGLVQALAAGGDTLIVADKLVHASVIDGIRLSGAPFERFRHNDVGHLERIIEKNAGRYRQTLVIVESVYSMDGDRADISALADLRRRHEEIMLYVDEAHAVGVEGPGGLGLCAASGRMAEIDVIVGTFGKALASSGAFCITSAPVREYLVNRARPLIFSTAIPPLCARWSSLMLRTAIGMDTEREHLRRLGITLSKGLSEISDSKPAEPSHIQPLIVGNAAATVKLSEKLLATGFKVLPIRTPTVPPGTERLRISLSAALTADTIGCLVESLKSLLTCKAD